MELSDTLIKRLAAGLYSSFRDYNNQSSEQENQQQGDMVENEKIVQGS